MSQIHLYGTDYVSLNPPKDWVNTGVESTVNDSLIEANLNTNIFSFVGDSGEFLMNWRNTAGKGVFNGVPYRIIYVSNKPPYSQSVIFDGYIDLAQAELNSKINPVIISAPVVELEKPVSVIGQQAVITQGLLKKKGVLTGSDFIDVPVIRESKKNVAERGLILYNYGSKVVIAFMQIVNNMLSSISDSLGLSILIGVVEMLVTFLNAVIVIKRLANEGQKIVDLFFPIIYYYKGFNLAGMIRKGFEYKNYTVDYGILEPFLQNVYMLASQNEENGSPIQNFPAFGLFKPNDYGYTIGELIDGLNLLTNLRGDVRDNVVWLKNRLDPDWVESPVYQPENYLIKSVDQYQNGIFKDDCERVKSTVMINYQYDMSDAHTLTAKIGDSYEIHRDLINEIDPRMNTIKGIQEIDIPWAMCVRKQPFDNLWDLFTGISGEFDMYLQIIKDKITQFQSSLTASGIATAITDILDQTPFGTILNQREGCLKIDDNAYAIPKILYMTETENGLRIPSDFKNYIGGEAIYNNWYFGESPAIQNDFLGQWQLIQKLDMRWSYEKYIQTQLNPYFPLLGNVAKFNFISWVEPNHKSTADIEMQEPFDTNITESEVVLEIDEAQPIDFLTGIITNLPFP